MVDWFNCLLIKGNKNCLIYVKLSSRFILFLMKTNLSFIKIHLKSLNAVKYCQESVKTAVLQNARGVFTQCMPCAALQNNVIH